MILRKSLNAAQMAEFAGCSMSKQYNLNLYYFGTERLNTTPMPSVMIYLGPGLHKSNA